MERSDDTYVNFKLTAVLCRLLGQFPVISMKSLNTIEFKLISIVSVASLSIYTYSIYFIIQLIEKGWLYYVYNFFYIQLILFYYINYFKHKKIITFLKEIKLFDDEACALLNIRALYHNPLKKYYWLGCSILSLSSQILLIFFLTTINLSTLRRTDFLHMFCRLSLYLPGINYIFMLNELEVRLCMLRHSLIDSLSKMEKYPINIMNHLIIEKYRFLHARAIHCLTAFMDAYSVFLPAEFYISGLAIIINILGILSGFDTEELIRSVISAIYDTVCIFYIIHQSWKIGREVSQLHI